MNIAEHNDRIILIDRERNADLAVIYPDSNTAQAAIDNSLLIEDLCQEDCLEAWIPINGIEVDLEEREVIEDDFRLQCQRMFV